jgi:integrase
MTDAEIAAVKKVVTTPAQRLIVTLTAIYAARAKAIREVRLDDVDHDTRHITIGGHRHRLVEFAYDVVLDWLRQRHRLWPHTSNPYLLVSMGSATGTGPINDYYLTWHLGMRGVQLEQIRSDRILREALDVDADPLHLAAAFNLSAPTAINYSEIARRLLQHLVETDYTSITQDTTTANEP